MSKSLNRWYFILMLICLFAFPNICTSFNINYRSVQGICIALSSFIIIYNKRSIHLAPLTLLITFILLYSVFKLYTDHSEGIKAFIIQISGAPIIFAALYKTTINSIIPDSNLKLWQSFYRFLLYFFICVTGIAIIELLIGHSIFGWLPDSSMELYETERINDFRSCSLLGHPLYNALCISTIMSFILCTPLKNKYKYSLWSIGYIAILCFNTRSSIVGNLLLLSIYIFYNTFFSKRVNIKNKVLTLFIFIIIIFSVFTLINTTGIGGRLLELGLFDEDSAQTRIDIWTIFNFTDIKDILFGINSDKFSLLLYQSGLFVTENYWIDQLFRFGLVFMIPYILFYIAFCKEIYKDYGIFKSIFTCMTFILISSTNNSLSTNYLAILIFLLCIIIFHPKNFYRLVPKKYLNIHLI